MPLETTRFKCSPYYNLKILVFKENIPKLDIVNRLKDTIFTEIV